MGSFRQAATVMCFSLSVDAVAQAETSAPISSDMLASPPVISEWARLSNQAS
jgi:hypothetical protein